MTRLRFIIALVVLALSASAGGALSGMCWTAWAEAQSAKLLTAQEIRLVDASGRTRALLSLLRGRPRLIMTDQNGEFRVELGMDADGLPNLTLRDRNGRARTFLALTSQDQPTLRCADEKGGTRIRLDLRPTGDPALIMQDQAGRDRLALWQEAGELGLALADTSGRPRAGLVIKADRPALSFYDQDQAVIWSAPPAR